MERGKRLFTILAWAVLLLVTAGGWRQPASAPFTAWASPI